MIKNYFLSAIRGLSRSKFNTLINIVGLAVSMACAIFVYALIRHQRTFDAFHSKADRIYRVVTDVKTSSGVAHEGAANFALANVLRTDFPQLETVSQVYTEGSAVLAVSGASEDRKVFEQKGITYADEYFLKTFDYQVLAGRKQDLLSGPDEVILTVSLVEKLFGVRDQSGYEALIGRPVEVNKHAYQVSAILQDIPSNTNVPFKILLPFKAFERQNPFLKNNWKEVWGQSYTFITLPENYAPEALEKALIPIKNKYHDRETALQYTYRLQPLREVHSDETYGGTVYSTPNVLIIAFVAMAAIVLLTACINFINLATAYSLKRAKEIGIRKTLGSSTGELVLRFMLETLLLVLTAAGLGLFLAQQFITSFNSYLSFIIELGLKIDTTVIYFLAVIVVVTTLLAGYYPARVMAGYKPVQALKNTVVSSGTGFSGKLSLRKVLVMVQFAVTQLLIIGTIVVAMQMKYFRSRDLGYLKQGMLVVELPENDAQKREVFRNRLLAQPEVLNVSFSSGPPTSASQAESEFRLPSAGPNDVQNIERKYIDSSFLATYDIKLLAGRNLASSDRITLRDSSRYNVLINRRTMAALGFRAPSDALGQPMVVDKTQIATIIGVVDDFFNVPLQKEIRPCLLFYGTNWISIANIRLDPARPVSASTVRKIEENWRDLYPDQVYKGMALEEYMGRQAFYVLEDIMFQAFKIFVVISLLIGCMGLYGLVSYLSLQRQKEIGIRKVLGASVTEIVLMFSREFALLILVAFVIAAPLGYLAMNTWLQTFAYKITMRASYFLSAFAISLVIAGLTIGYQALKAATANPVKSLRTE